MNTYYVAGIPYSDELFHHGIKGQKWGIRRYQNLDGTLTAEGRERYGDNIENVSEGKLKRQVMRNNMASSTGERNRQSYGEYKKMKKYLNDKKSPFSSVESSKTFEEINNYVKRFAKAQLRDMGYSDSDKAAEYLLSKDWYTMPYGYLVGRKSMRAD